MTKGCSTHRNNPKLGCATCRRIEVEIDIVTKVVDALLAAGYRLATDNGGDTYETAITPDRDVVLPSLMQTDDERLYVWHKHSEPDYRIEHSTAEWTEMATPVPNVRPGPWSVRWDDRFRLRANDMSTPHRDGISLPIIGRACGLRSRDDIDRWFGPDAALLTENGFVIGVYEVPEQDVEHGQQQLMFRGDRARRIAHLPLTPLGGN
jgi:hypothetical protein